MRRRGGPPRPLGDGLAQGELIPIVPSSSFAALSCGEPIVRAIGLARIARTGELLVDPEFSAVQEGELLTFGSRVGRDGARRARGLVIDPRRAFRHETAERSMAQLARPPLQKHGPIADFLLSRAPLVFLRADAGFGGTRLLTELEAACLPGRSLLLATAGAEPLGALRCAFVRSIAMHGPPPEGALEDDERAALAQLLAGNGAEASARGQARRELGQAPGGVKCARA